MCQPFGLEDFEPGTSGHDLPFEIGCGTKVIFKVGKVLGFLLLTHLGGSGLQFLLRVVQGQVAQIVFLPAKSSQNDLFSLGSIAYHNAKALAEELGGVETFLDSEGLVSEHDVLDTVEGEDGKASIVELAQQVPALTEELDAVGREGEGLGIRRLVAAVGDADSLAFFHGFDHQFQVFAIGGDVLEHNAMLEAHALTNDVADGQGREHPVLHGILSQHLSVAYIVAVAILAVASM